jgi:hypothetical protein
MLELDRPVHPAPPSPTHAGADMREEAAFSTIQRQMDRPVVDPRFSTLGQYEPTIGTPRLSPIPLDLPTPFRHTPPPTLRRPPLPLSLTIHPALGDRSDGYSPSSPLLSYLTPVRHGVPIAELVDEEGSSPGTRGGITSSRPAATCVNMSLAQSYPPLSISIVDVTPHPFGRESPEDPKTPDIESPCPSPPSPPETPRFFTTQTPGPSRSPLMSSAGGGEKTPRRYKRKGAPSTAPEVPVRRLTRSGKAAESFEMDTTPSKRVKTSPS